MFVFSCLNATDLAWGWPPVRDILHNTLDPMVKKIESRTTGWSLGIVAPLCLFVFNDPSITFKQIFPEFHFHEMDRSGGDRFNIIMLENWHICQFMSMFLSFFHFIGSKVPKNWVIVKMYSKMVLRYTVPLYVFKLVVVSCIVFYRKISTILINNHLLHIKKFDIFSNGISSEWPKTIKFLKTLCYVRLRTPK